MLTGIGRRLAASGLFCLVILLIGLRDARAESNEQSLADGDSPALFEPDKLEFIAGPGCVSMPAGVSKLYFNASKIKSAASVSVATLLDSAVVDGGVVCQTGHPLLSAVAFSEEFAGFLAAYDVDYVARNVPPAVPGETFQVISEGLPIARDLSVFYRVHFAESLGVDNVKAALEEVPCVDSVGYWPRIECYVDSVYEPFRGPFCDELTDGQWQLRAPSAECPGGIDVEGAWRIIWDSLVSLTSPEIVVTIIDSRFGTKLHVDLESNVHPESQLDFSAVPWGAHGTWVAGVVSASAGNRWRRDQVGRIQQPSDLAVNRGMGIVGVAPTCRALLFGQGGLFSLEGALEDLASVLYNVGSRCDVMNMSWGFGNTENATLRALTEVAYYDRDIPLVAAAGNIDYPTIPPFVAIPAVYSHVISTGSITETGEVARYSNRGSVNVHMKVDMLAPGDNILTAGSDEPKVLPPPETFDENGWDTQSGTSFSAPMVTGIVALMKVANPDLCAATICDILKESCHQPAGYTT